MRNVSRSGTAAAWIMAARPRTLPASTSGVIVGSALAFAEGRFALLPALASFVVALALQIASNFANDVYDFESGADAKRSHGPTRVTQSGILSPREVKTGLLVVIGVAILAGAWLILRARSVAPDSWLWLLAAGLLAVVASVGYSTGPFPLARLGLGDLFVLLFFGFVATAGSFEVQAGHLGAAPILLSLGPGLVIVAILVVNNLRDIEEDRVVGKRTLAVRFGSGFAKSEYIGCLALSYLVLALTVALGLVSVWGLLALASLPLAVKNTRVVLAARGQALNAALAGTGLLSFAWALLFAAGLIAARLFG
ncbi:MAG TPA: 1,4-dihydroxy-2-naphthoate polyprenyltransferase [Rectinemataceae bacterium]|nr:1,4-dihydroxy-2-naphthoate polyprenyltransferase [Rectinemataceae bacterium]